MLIKDDGTLVAVYDSDAYGNAVGFDPSTAATSLLYTGEFFDKTVEQYVLRARYYDASIGRFSSFDSYEGNASDLVSLHKYLYANANTVYYIDPSGMFSVGETFVVTAIRTFDFAVKAYPVIRAGLAGWDGITIVRIRNRGFTGGFDTVSASDWAQFGLSTVGLVGLAPGSKLAAKTLVSTFLKIPIGPSLRSFEGAKLAVGQLVKLEQVTEPLAQTATSVTLGRFHVYELGTAVVRYFKTGNPLQDATTLIHELVHYTHWVMKGKPVGQAFKEFQASSVALEAAHGVFEKIAKIVMSLAE